VSEDSRTDAGGLLAGLAAGGRVGGYLLEEQVGAGGMAVVFRAADERLRRRVALKVLAPAFAADAEFRQRFIREFRAASAVDDPHIIPVYEAGEASGVLFIAMRYVPGGDVRTLLHQGPLAPDRTMAIISPVASALDAAHAAGLVHRDVKPANMLLDARPGRPDHVYLSDFGLSKGALSSAGLTVAGQHLGTPDYMAPEQIEGRRVDGRTDQYALACAAFELLAGTTPFQRDQGMAVLLAHLSQPPPPLGSRRPGLPTAVDQVFARALAKAPGNRFASCREFADALRSALGVAVYHAGPGASPAAEHPAVPHPATEIAGPPGPDAGPTAIPAGDVAASTIGPAPGRVSTPAGSVRSGPDPGTVQPTRRRRVVQTALAGASIAAFAAVAAVVLTSSPGHKLANPANGKSASSLSVKVEVLNGSGIDGIATKAAGELTSRGFDVAGTGLADNFNYNSSVIEYAAASDLRAVDTLKAQLSNVKVVHNTALGPGTIELIIGSAFSGLDSPASPGHKLASSSSDHQAG
jgi:hypothetical protein